MPPQVHVIGAGLAGLSAAVRVAQEGHRVTLHEAAGQAGGRCRSYFDASFGGVIDNGNHLLLSGNTAALAFLTLVGGAHKLQQPNKAEIAFVDLATDERWTLTINEGLWPAWLFNSAKRVPGTRPWDYLGAVRLLWAKNGATVANVLESEGALYTKLWRLFMLSALNTDPKEGSAKLAGAIVRNTLMKGGAACRPMIAEGLSAVFVEPALDYLTSHGGAVEFASRLRSLKFEGERCISLDFGGSEILTGDGDAVILAVPPVVARDLLPGLETPTEFHAIVNGHFKLAPPLDMPPILAVLNATVEWVFAFPDRLSITISGADRLADRPREELAPLLWADVCAAIGLDVPLPPWQIVKERRATFAATPTQDAKRPGTNTRWNNVFLAGDWTQTGLPATIEGAVRSGQQAASIATKGH